jgi:cytochrome c biogenesis protein CcmG/thiol:disulfide interchange protein DsbE
MPEQLAITDAMPTQAIDHINGIARRRLLLAMPAVGFAGLAGLLFAGLGRDAGRLPSTLIGQAAPKFSLPAVGGRRLGLANTDLLGEVSLVNVFASWCVACRAEHPLLMRLAHDKTVPVHGIDYKDAPEDAARWLNTMGDPYTRTGADRDGRVAIDWGVYGVPETFVVGADGIVAAKQIGPLTQEALEETILPLVARLRQEAERRQS